MASPRPTATPAPTGSLSDTPKIVLPNNLAQTLQYLSDDDLKALRVNVENGA
jgi:hypothetical protein